MNGYRPEFEQFKRLAADYQRVPVAATFVCDDLTPVSAFARLAGESEHAFLLESVIGGEKIARYSFLGCDPAIVFEAHGRHTSIRRFDASRVRSPAAAGRAAESDPAEKVESADPLRLLEQELNRHKRPAIAGLPRFVGGAVGFAAYDVVRYYERLPNAPPDDRGLPDLLFGIYESMVIFDHVNKTVLIVSHADTGRPAQTAYDDAARRIADIAARLSRPAAVRPVQVRLPCPPRSGFVSNLDRKAFEGAVEACKEYIRAGDIFQVVFSQRLTLETAAKPFDIYRALRVVNPSPFMFYLKSPQVTLVGASPEIMCRVEDGIVTNRPLAGTRKRGATEQEDRALRDELLADPKERAEHVMLVDLGRNDVGRVAEPGSVRITETMAVEYYSHVMHICSNVTGKLAAGKTAFDALRATLPVGTVSGAPKVRAMQIIDQFEPTRRGPYAGAVGYVDFAGNMDTCIALRTMVIQPDAGSGGLASAGPDPGKSRVHIQVGAGIVADSVPEREYQETLNKANGMLSAIRVAEEHFG